MLRKKTAVAGLVLVALIATGCSAPAAPEDSKEPAPAPSPAESETPTADDTAADVHAFGDTVQLEFDGSVWDVTIQAPIDAPPRLTESFPLDEAGTRYVIASGTVKRVEGPSVEPIEELSVDAIVNNAFVSDEYLGDDEYVSLNAAPQLLVGGEATFTQSYVVGEGDEVKTIVVSLGMGEASSVAVFGEPVDFGDGAEG
ncbi:hypothetical protein AB0O70_05370 [Microbacterium paraoxydans]|uniref:hypothetical protein n=1 Tax=Microbacterium paraoxydans TaxID=199592 RepID=UPI00341F5C5C